MRTGAIFARGSCRALKWMALFGVVFAVGAGQVTAQETARALTGATFEIKDTTPTEGATSMANTITATLSAEVPPGSTTETTVTIAVAAAPLLGTDADQRAVLETLGATPAEDGDWTIADTDSSTDGTNAEFTFVFPANPTTNSMRYVRTDDVVLQTGNTDNDAEDEGLRLTGGALTVSETDPDGAGPATAFTPTVHVGVAGTAALTDLSGTTKDIKIDDRDDQTYVLTRTVPTTAPMEGAAITVTVEAIPPHVQGATTLTLRLGMPALGYELGTIEGGASRSADTVTLGDPDTTDNTATVAGATEASNKATIPLTATAAAMNDGDRVDSTLTLRAYSGVNMLADGRKADGTQTNPLEIPLKDKHALPMVKMILVGSDGEALNPQPPTVTEGMDYGVKLIVVDEDGMAVTSRTGEALMATLMSTGDAVRDGDWSLDGYPIFRIDEDAVASEMAELQIDRDDDLNTEFLMLSATVTGNDAMYGDPQPGLNPMDVLSLRIIDDTDELVWAKTEAEIDAAVSGAKTAAMGGDNPGEDFSLMGSALFNTAPGYTATYVATSDGNAVEASSDGSTIMVKPMMAGTAMVTVTATAQQASAATIPPQTVPNVAEIMFEVMVEDPPLEAPGTPENFVATGGDGQVRLSWRAPSTGGAVETYRYREANDDDWHDTTNTTVTLGGLENNTRYVFHVKAANAAGESDVASAEATPEKAADSLTVKSVSAATSVAESGGLEVTVTANVPAGTEVDGKVAPIALKYVVVDIVPKAGDEGAETGDTTLLGTAGTNYYEWKNIPRTEKASTSTFKFRVAIGQDLDAEDEKFNVKVTIDGDSEESEDVTIDDAQEQEYVLSLPSAAKGVITEGAKAVELTLQAKPEKTFDIPFTLTLEAGNSSMYTLGGSTSGSFGRDSVKATIAAKSDGDRDSDEITVTAYTAADHVELASLDSATLTSLEIAVKDANALPMVKAMVVDEDGKEVEDTMSVAEGETVKIMLTVVDEDGEEATAAENLSISLEPTGAAGAQDYRLSGHPIEIASGKKSSAAVDLMITEDQDVGEEDLTFNAVVSGDPKVGPGTETSMGVLSLVITDGTQKLVYAKTEDEVRAAIYGALEAGMGDDMTFTAGEMIEVMGNDLFSSAEGVTVSYTAESDMTGVASTSVSGGTVMVTAEGEGMAHITITAHASTPSGVDIVDQTDPGMASVVFPVEVGLEALTIMLSGPEDDMDLVEGGMGAMVTATANRAVTEDVTVMLMRDRSMSSAADADFSAEDITIAAGAMMGSTMVMAVEDNMAEDMEELVLYGMAEGMAGEVTGEVHLHIWDAAVPALPVIAQLLLAAFLAFGGYRRYRRR